MEENSREVCRVPFKIELKVAGTHFVWKNKTLFFHCMNEVHRMDVERLENN